MPVRCSAFHRDFFLSHIEASITEPAQNAIPPRLIAEAISYSALRDALRARAKELGIARLEIDQVGRLPAGHSGGLLGQNSSRTFGIRSLEKLLKALGVRLWLVEDVATTARTTRLMFRKRSEPQALESDRHWRNVKRKPPVEPMRAAAHKPEGSGEDLRGPVTVSELGQRGARALNASRTAAERSAAASRAASARWARPASTRSHGAGA